MTVYTVSRTPTMTLPEKFGITLDIAYSLYGMSRAEAVEESKQPRATHSRLNPNHNLANRLGIATKI
jgi:hypothetical protein